MIIAFTHRNKRQANTLLSANHLVIRRFHLLAKEDAISHDQANRTIRSFRGKRMNYMYREKKRECTYIYLGKEVCRVECVYKMKLET